MINLSKEQIISMHGMLIKQTGGLDGLRDENLLDSALNTPYQTFAGEELYPTVQKRHPAYALDWLITTHSMTEIKELVF